MVLVDAVKHHFLDALLGCHHLAAARSAVREARFYRDDNGVKRPIDLQPHIASGRLAELSATETDVNAVAGQLQRRHGPGEVESIALVVAHGHRFCTADRLAVRSLKRLGVLDRWVPLEDLLSTLNPPLPIPDAKYSRAAAEPK
jgi:hypothetical protein